MRGNWERGRGRRTTLATQSPFEAGPALVGSSSIDTPPGWAFLALAGAGMGVAVPGLVAGATEALDPDRAGIASARQQHVAPSRRRDRGHPDRRALDDHRLLTFSAASLLLGGVLALALIGAVES